MERRTLLRGVIGGLGASMIPQAGNGDAIDIAAETVRTDSLKAAYRLGTSGTLLDLENHAFRLRDALRTLRAKSDRVKLGRAFTDAAHFVGHAHYNATNYDQAVWWIEQAHGIAELTGDRAMVAVAFARKSLVYAAENDTTQAIVLAGIGKRLDAGPWAEGFAETHLAYAHAKDSNPYQVLSAMDRAETAFDRAVIDGTPPPFETVTDRLAQLNYHRGKLLVRSDPKKAEPYLASILNSLPSDRRLRRGGIQIRRADIAASLREFEQAVNLAKEGYAIASDGGVTRDIDRVRQLRARIRGIAPARLVAELDEVLSPHRSVRGSVLWRNDRR